MAVQIQLRRGLASAWTSANPTLAEGEMGVETDTDKFKLGDGVTAWNSLGYGGIQGESAYEVAVNNGFVGTEAEWLSSLNGSDGLDGADGIDGSFSSAQTITNLSQDYTLQTGDEGKLFTNSAAVTVTVGGLTAGQQVDFLQTNAGQITFVAGQGITLSSKDGNLKTAAQYSPASLKFLDQGNVVLVGDLGA